MAAELPYMLRSTLIESLWRAGGLPITANGNASNEVAVAEQRSASARSVGRTLDLLGFVNPTR